MKKIIFFSVVASVLMLAGIARADFDSREDEAEKVGYQHDQEAGHHDQEDGHKDEAASPASDTEFGRVYRIVAGWALGYLGKTIAISFFLIGMVIGVTRQSLKAVAVGLGCSLSIYYFPHIINALNALHRQG